MKKIATIVIVAAWAVLATSCINGNTFVEKTRVQMTYDDADLYSSGDCEVATDSVREIEIDWVKGKIAVEAYDGKTISVTECGEEELAEDFMLRYLLKDGVLKIKYAKSGKLEELPEKHLTVKVPAKLVLDGLDIAVATGDVTVTGVTAKHTEVEGATSAVTCTALTASSVEVQSATGNVSLDLKESEEVELKSVEVEAAVGEVRVMLPEGKGYEAEATAALGKVRCEGAEKVEKHEYKRGDGAVEIEISTATGNITIK